MYWYVALLRLGGVTGDSSAPSSSICVGQAQSVDHPGEQAAKEATGSDTLIRNSVYFTSDMRKTAVGNGYRRLQFPGPTTRKPSTVYKALTTTTFTPNNCPLFPLLVYCTQHPQLTDTFCIMGDYSSTLTIHNNLNVGLRFVDKTSPIGYWLRQPDRGILDNDRSNQMQLKDKAGKFAESGIHNLSPLLTPRTGFLGTDGTVTYKASINNQDVQISIYVACPMGKANIARITSGPMDGSDHPLISTCFLELMTRETSANRLLQWTSMSIPLPLSVSLWHTHPIVREFCDFETRLSCYQRCLRCALVQV